MSQIVSMTNSRDKNSSSAPSVVYKPVIALPITPLMKSWIDEALNFVVEKAAARACLETGTLGRCTDYAIVGARVLSRLSGHAYSAVAGGELIDCGGGRFIVLFPARSARRHARKLSDLKEYHCWIESTHITPEGDARLEWIDFTIRHDGLVADMLGVPYLNSRTDSYLWDWRDNIREVPLEARSQLSVNGKSGAWMWTDEVCMRLLSRYEKEHDKLYNDLVAQVLHRLADIIEMNCYR